MNKLLLGGSPCTHWSIAQTKERETAPSGQGWELFKNFLIAKEKYKPNYFLYENNKSMAPAIKEQITKELGVQPILINSALVSAQNRQRYYWANIPNVTQPADKGILLKDILESGREFSHKNEKAYCLTANYYKAINGTDAFNGRQSGQRLMVAEPVCLRYERTDYAKSIRKGYENGEIQERMCNLRNLQPRPDGKTNTLTTVLKDNIIAEPIRIGTIENNAQNADFDSKQYRVYTADGKIKKFPIYEVKNGFITIKEKEHPIRLADGFYIIRKLTVTECRRLQTIPDNYKFPVSDTQAYKMLGNGWTVDVITHILSHIPNIKGNTAEVLSMYDGMSCGQIALGNLGVNICGYYATEIDKYAIKTTQTNFPQTVQLGDAFAVRNENWKI